MEQDTMIKSVKRFKIFSKTQKNWNSCFFVVQRRSNVINQLNQGYLSGGKLHGIGAK